MKKLKAADEATQRALSIDVTDTGNQLHGRHGHLVMPFLPAFLLEVALTLAAKCVGFVMLAVYLQPLIIIVTGLVLGVRYSQAYLWYFEPRFKKACGAYLFLARQRHLGLDQTLQPHNRSPPETLFEHSSNLF